MLPPGCDAATSSRSLVPPWPVAARAQQGALPVIALINGQSLNGSERYGAAFHKGLGDAGDVEGQNASIEYHWLGGQYDGLSVRRADLSGNARHAMLRRVAGTEKSCTTPGALPNWNKKRNCQCAKTSANAPNCCKSAFQRMNSRQSRSFDLKTECRRGPLPFAKSCGAD